MHLLEERTKTLAQEIDELNKAEESFIQLSLFEETFLRDKEAELESCSRRSERCKASSTAKKKR